ncbi:MAG TPA: glycoside hydrolase family 140 protein, partial [Puia sp.]|nr:glycoside hydrolase family 140 protein [Puia sp.]
KKNKNIIWILGGDRNPQNETELQIWRSMAAGILEGVGGSGQAMITYHPQPNDQGSGQYFFNDDWLSLNMFQNGHCRNTPVYDKIYTAWLRTPAKPVLDGEPIYEDHPVCFNVKELGTSNALDIRQYAYLDLFSGACGHTYGCHDIWQFYSKEHEAINGPHIYWPEALQLTGASQMKYVRKLMESHPMTERIPDQSVVLENNLSASERIQATRGMDYIFIYSAAGKPFTVVMGKIEGKTLNVSWFNPRNGSVSKDPQVGNTGNIQFKPPTSGYGQDWVLILDDATKNYTIN